MKWSMWAWLTNTASMDRKGALGEVLQLARSRTAGCGRRTHRHQQARGRRAPGAEVRLDGVEQAQGGHAASGRQQ